MLPAEDLFVCVYVLIDDAIAGGAVAIPPRPGPAPACSDAGLLTIAQVRHLPGRRSEAGFLAEVARDWAHLFPALPHQSEASRLIRWLHGASGQFRAHLAAGVPADDCQQIDTSALPVTHTSRVRGPDGWTRPGGLHARFGRDAAHAEWFYGFRLAKRDTAAERRRERVQQAVEGQQGRPVRRACLSSGAVHGLDRGLELEAAQLTSRVRRPQVFVCPVDQSGFHSDGSWSASGTNRPFASTRAGARAAESWTSAASPCASGSPGTSLVSTSARCSACEGS